MGRRLYRAGAALMGLAIAAALSSLPARAADAPVWRHGILEAKSDAGIIMMVSQGFAEKAGLKLELSQFKSDVVELQALLSGELDSYDGGPTGAILAAARGVDIKIVGCHWPGLPYGIFVRNAIQSAQDLKGKTFAISAPGASPDVVARALLARNGVATADIRFANLGSDLDRFKALAAGVADAAVVSLEYEPIAAKQGVKVLIAARDILPNQIRSCFFTTGKVLQARPDDMVAFLAAQSTALRYALTHRAETIALTDKLSGAKPDDPRPGYFFDDAVASKSVDPDLTIPRDKLDWMVGEMVKQGLLAHPFDIGTMIDGRFRTKALALAGK